MSDSLIFNRVRGELRSRWPEWTALTLFAAVVAFAIPYHESWIDEAQAWQLARSLSLRELFQTYIRYEAAPGLWYLFLWILNRAHVGYTAMHWICGAIAVVSTSLLVFLSPFPRYLKLTLPFTFFLLFQYAVVARSYVLVPPILFAIAFWWKKSPLLVSICLGLLANLALHAATFSGGLAIVWLVEQLRSGNVKAPVRRRHLLLCTSIIVVFYAFAIWTAWPPADFSTHVSYGLSTKVFDTALAALILPVCQPAILSILFWILVVPVFGARRRLWYLLPVLFLEVFCGFLTSSFWQWGLVVPLMICLLWITWPSPEPVKSPPEIFGRAALLYMVASQIVWSAYALNFDHYNAYSPHLAAAQYLMPRVKAGATVAITYLDDSPDPNMANNIFSATGILPYFDRNIYINQPYPFYLWRNGNPSASLFYEILPSHPKIVIANMQRLGRRPFIELGGKKAEQLVKSGYTLTHIFCGSVPFQTQLVSTSCHVIYEYTGNAP